MEALLGDLADIDDVTAPDGICVPRWVCNDPQRRAVMLETITVRLDLTKNVFQVHGADAQGCSFPEAGGGPIGHAGDRGNAWTDAGACRRQELRSDNSIVKGTSFGRLNSAGQSGAPGFGPGVSRSVMIERLGK